ncbi:MULTISPECIES: hypothetical protein [Spongiibacter]|uniref:hypothetical protein n=1 Tax=Spongiibacter TaxID=630749 RepID=UPI001B2F5CA1|nr:MULTISPECIES: hypothetical protein [Spongiibacter]MBO6753631.1 hypothetical protein [Spongiibacter sp.]
MNDAQPLINIAICSCQRPRLLNQALGSLATSLFTGLSENAAFRVPEITRLM